MSKVRFSCPRCQTVMQTQEDKIGYDIACPHCAYRFKLVEPSPAPGSNESNASNDTDDIYSEQTIAPGSGSNVPQTRGINPAPNLTTNHPYQASASPGPDEQPKGGFQCPYCQSRAIPKMESEVNTTGWIVFGVLLVTTCFFCWVGLLIRDKYKSCSNCNIRL